MNPILHKCLQQIYVCTGYPFPERFLVRKVKMHEVIRHKAQLGASCKLSSKNPKRPPESRAHDHLLGLRTL